MEKQKKKVLFLITKSNFGGAQRYVYDLATGLPTEEFEVVVALGGEGSLAEKLKTSGIKVVNIPSLQRDISVSKEIKSFFEIAKILQTERPDIFHINSSKAGALGALIGRLTGVPKIVFTSHGWAFNEERPFWQRLILKKIHWLTVLLSHQTIAVSDEVNRQMNWPFVKNKMVVIYNGRDITDLKNRESARDFLTKHAPLLLPYRNDFWSITIAELHRVKRHDAVIEAMVEVAKEFPNTRHLIIGAGEQEKFLRQKIENLNLNQNIFLLGAIPEAAQYLKAADLFILASRSEAMPYAIIEATIAGLPIIATRVGGIGEIIENEKNGLLVEPLNNKALTKAILELRKSVELQRQLAKAALERSKDFNFETTLQKTIAVYHSA